MSQKIVSMTFFTDLYPESFMTEESVLSPRLFFKSDSERPNSF